MSDTPEIAADAEPEDADMRRLRNATAALMEHFDTVQIFVTREQEGGTIAANFGGGNWYARRGQVGVWMVRQDAIDAGGE